MGKVLPGHYELPYRVLETNLRRIYKGEASTTKPALACCTYTHAHICTWQGAEEILMNNMQQFVFPQHLTGYYHMSIHMTNHMSTRMSTHM